ncbi:dual specificity protein phosphatase Mpk3-like isoform X1 [Rhagoletis pomonella]|uniref:dual specificity protein phosphatase Mpk3-like isoform X1 n=1 Tax=Rhagoletis pomonella TaxID=28610 RepID=UPI001786E1B3|nr:dual specificity protein phosphatase Mpk3-like isoform X1 [Rhagoletis pomonella]
MPETEFECITKEWLQAELRSISASSQQQQHSHTHPLSSLLAQKLILLDCRSSHEFSESRIRSAVNFFIPSIMLRRLALGKIDLLSTIKSTDLKERVQKGYKVSLFVLYNDAGMQEQPVLQAHTSTGAGGTGEALGGGGGAGCGLDMMCGGPRGNNVVADATINILYRRLKQDGCRVVVLQDGFSSFRQAFPEWCEDDSAQNKEMESSHSTQADQLMGLRSLRISTPHSDSACSSSAESSDCESTTHHNINEAPVEIIPGLFLGNESHSCDSRALQKYNIKYVLNVTPDLPNVFESSGDIQYLQIPITDHYSQDLAMHFPDAIRFIEEARSNNAAVLVHCLAGVSRSVTVTLAYLMQTRTLSLNDAFTLVRDRKPDVAPNFHFMEQLHSFERKLRPASNSGEGSSSGSGDNECTAMDESGGGGSGSGIPSCTANTSLANTLTAGRCGGDLSSKFTCNCIATDCKCMQTGGYMAQLAKAATGVSPDSGIEFDRWTPSSDTGLK